MRLFGGGSEERFETVISAGSLIRGDITAKGPVRVEGHVQGDVSSEDAVVVGRDGEIRGNISGRSVTVGGQVTGRIEAAERVELLGTARLTGEVWSPRLAMEEGASYEGQVRMEQGAPFPKAGAVRRRDKAEPPRAPAAPETGS
jgi:cytoskeletal protein CcmA (bactofilin family)